MSSNLRGGRNADAAASHTCYGLIAFAEVERCEELGS